MTALLRYRLFRSAAAVGAAAALLGGCAASPRSPEEPRSPGAPPGAVPSSAARGLPSAADGTDLAACADTECEVEVAEGDEFSVEGPHGLDRMVVAKVAPEEVTVTGYGADNSSRVSGTTGAPFDGRPSIVLNGVTVAVLAVADNRAVIRLAYEDVELPDLPDLEGLGGW